MSRQTPSLSPGPKPSRASTLMRPTAMDVASASREVAGHDTDAEPVERHRVDVAREGAGPRPAAEVVEKVQLEIALLFLLLLAFRRVSGVRGRRDASTVRELLLQPLVRGGHFGLFLLSRPLGRDTRVPPIHRYIQI